VQATRDMIGLWALLLSIGLPIVMAWPLAALERWVRGAIGWIAALMGLVGLAALLLLVPGLSETPSRVLQMNWVPSLGLRLAFRLDGLSLTFAITIAAVGSLVLLYSGDYLKGHPNRGRFIGFLSLFLGAMQGLVLVDSIVGLYAFWELTSLASFLLIGFDAERQAARRGATQALVVTGIGGLALLAGGVVLALVTRSWQLSGVGESLVASPAFPLLAGLFLLAATTKSAQVPFHFWLPNAMEAPTPVSALLHSATMVQAGVYLVLRLAPVMSGGVWWNGTLLLLGALTLCWGAFGSFRNTDLKQVLAQTTIASLGLLMLLTGIGSELALAAALIYFVAHALYKAALFLVVGGLDHGTGTRDITTLRGLREPMSLSFIAALMAGAAMLGVPPLLGFWAKEEMYQAASLPEVAMIAVLVVLVVGNVLLGAIGLLLAIRPFMGVQLATPKLPHEAPWGMILGPLLLGVAGLALALLPGVVEQLLAPALAAVAPDAHAFHMPANIEIIGLPFLLSMLTWVLAVAVFRLFDPLRMGLNRVLRRVPSLDRGFDRAYFGLVRLAGAVTRFFHHGRLEIAMLTIFVAVAAAVLLPLALTDGWPVRPNFPQLRFEEWGVMALAVAGVLTVVFAPGRLMAILALGVQGTALSLIFLLFGAPDLGFTQFMVEILSVVILGLVMTRLRLEGRDPRPMEDWLRDGAVALVAGGAVTLLLLRVLETPLDPRLSDFFNANSAAVAHGKNIVNVILVDFRGLDTLGEISVVMAAGIAVLALIRVARVAKPAPVAPEPEPVAVNAALEVPVEKPKRVRRRKPA
jgi:multicomponent Na+:H+ antiporter subunit A